MRIHFMITIILCIPLFLSACNETATNSEQKIEENEDNPPQKPADPTDQSDTTTPKSANNLSVRLPNDQLPRFKNVSVHDPSIIKAGQTYYVFGSHLAAAKSEDFIQWTQLSTHVFEGNPLIPNVYEEMSEALEWAETDTFWAGDVIQLKDGRFYMYYSVCKGDSPRSALGLAVADHIEGPYENVGILLKSGMWGQASEDGTVYDATVHPNAIDPHVFYDKEGKLWMVYGSYSGGIYILEMDEETGMPLPDQGYGKKLLGANHSRIEGPYILYSSDTDYYYLFLSFGGLDANGGYNLRIARSKQPDGPYYDAEGNDMIEARGLPHTFFDDRAIEPYGVKLVGNFEFNNVEGEIPNIGTGYVSPGHNSAYYDEKTGQYYLIFHTRFPNRGEAHELRVHKLLINEQDWLVMAPHRYSGEHLETYPDEEVYGEYKFVNHGKDISAEIKSSVLIELAEDGTIHGSVRGTWSRTGEHTVQLTIDDADYFGVFLKQVDIGTRSQVMTFSALSNDGVAIWGSQTARSTQQK